MEVHRADQQWKWRELNTMKKQIQKDIKIEQNKTK